MTQAQPGMEALLRRIDELESRNAMRDLVTDYCRGFDSLNFDRFLLPEHKIEQRAFSL